MNANWPSDVLDCMFAHVLETEAELVAHLVVYDARHQDAARIGQGFQPCRHIDAIAKDVITINNDIANVNADAELDMRLSAGTSVLRWLMPR